MTVFYIDETNEFTKDRDLANGAGEAGLSVSELEEYDLVRWIEQSWKSRSELTHEVKNVLAEIERLIEEAANSEMKTPYLSMVHHHAQGLKFKIHLNYE